MTAEVGWWVIDVVKSVPGLLAETTIDERFSKLQTAICKKYVNAIFWAPDFVVVRFLWLNIESVTVCCARLLFDVRSEDDVEYESSYGMEYI